MTHFNLRTILLVDAEMSGISALVFLFGAGSLSPILGASADHIRIVGGLLALFALLVAWVAARVPPPALGAWTVIALNVTWVADSLLLWTSGWVPLTSTGSAFVLVQAVIVAAVAFLECVALRRQPRFGLSKA